jgi:tRNA-guanine family transglycosylase
VIARFGGLHRFMGWDGPILTDSGGFQIFSHRDTDPRADDDAVTFRSVYDGEEARFTPELAADVQRSSASDVAMCLTSARRPTRPGTSCPRRRADDALGLSARGGPRTGQRFADRLALDGPAAPLRGDRRAPSTGMRPAG